MNSDAFEECRRRFGDDVTSWPAPYRQQALAMLSDGHGSISDDDALDRLILDAVLMETDERKLTRQVLGRLNAERPRSGRFSFLAGFFLTPAGVSACAAALLLTISVGGYQVARLQGDPFDSQLLALASGTPFVGDDLSGTVGAEEENPL